ncbi:MAG: hypothetical protein ACLFPO_03700 [Spirochaetaceae bacterium]
MSDREPLHIFHVARQDGTSLFLHPFLDGQRVMERMESHPLEGLYGREPRVEAITRFRNDLYRLIEDQVRDWIGESRFIPRFLLAAGVFLIAFVVLSVAVRDPLPVLDEIGLSLAAAIAAFILRKRRDLRSDEALSKRMKLRTKVDGIVFGESEFVKRLEAVLHEDERASVEDVLEALAEGGESSLDTGLSGEAQEALSYLKARFNTRDHRKQEKRLLAAERGGLKDRDRDHLLQWAGNANVDFPLFALYVRLKRECAKRPTG